MLGEQTNASTPESSGNVGIGTTSPGYLLTVNGQPAANGYTAFTNYSDRRLKENIKPLDDGFLEKILALNPSTFSYNDKYYKISGYKRTPQSQEMRGFIAQELREVFPEMVHDKKIKGETFLDTNLSFLQIYLTKAVKELYGKWFDDSTQLHSENIKLRSEVDELKSYICSKDPKASLCPKPSE